MADDLSLRLAIMRPDPKLVMVISLLPPTLTDAHLVDLRAHLRLLLLQIMLLYRGFLDFLKFTMFLKT